jgi:hypothetical protein
MRIHTLGFLTLLTLSGTAALADAPADTGWYLASPKSAPSPFHIGSGAMAGMIGKQAVYVMGKTNPGSTTTTWNSASRYGALERKISLAAWRGKRVRLSLRLRNDGDLTGWSLVYLSEANGDGIRAFPQKTASGSGDWETHQFVLDIPANATGLTVAVGLAGQGKVWVDDLSLEAVGANIPVSDTRRDINTAPVGCEFHSGSENYADSRYNCGPPYPPFSTAAAKSLQ